MEKRMNNHGGRGKNGEEIKRIVNCRFLKEKAREMTFVRNSKNDLKRSK